MKKIIPAFVLLCTVSMPIYSLQAKEKTFKDYLMAEYEMLADYEYDRAYDYRAAKYYEAQVEALKQGVMVGPAKGSKYKISEAKRVEIAAERERLISALKTYSKPENRIVLAKAQSRFDCWLDQQEERHSGSLKYLNCKDEYEAAMAQVIIPEGMAVPVTTTLDDVIDAVEEPMPMAVKQPEIEVNTPAAVEAVKALPTTDTEVKTVDVDVAAITDKQVGIPFEGEINQVTANGQASLAYMVNTWKAHRAQNFMVNIYQPKNYDVELGAKQIEMISDILQLNGIPANNIIVSNIPSYTKTIEMSLRENKFKTEMKDANSVLGF